MRRWKEIEFFNICRRSKDHLSGRLHIHNQLLQLIATHNNAQSSKTKFSKIVFSRHFSSVHSKNHINIEIPVNQTENFCFKNTTTISFSFSIFPKKILHAQRQKSVIASLKNSPFFVLILKIKKEFKQKRLKQNHVGNFGGVWLQKSVWGIDFTAK